MPDIKGFLERRRAAWPWLDHVVRAAGRYQDNRGDYFAAGITYFSVFALFPLLMVAFAIGGFVLVRDPALLDSIEDAVTEAMPGDLGVQINELIDSAVAARATVGVFGLLVAAYSGLGWMANVREALTEMWEQQHPRSGFVATKLHDLAKLGGLFDGEFHVLMCDGSVRRAKKDFDKDTFKMMVTRAGGEAIAGEGVFGKPKK